MTTATSSATIAQDTYAHMQNWVGEVCGQLIACGLKQTNDSGQLTLAGSGASTVASWTSAALPTGVGIANAVAYILFTFNDTLAGGALSTTALKSGGSGYTNSAYTALVVTGAISGANNARASCTVSGGIAGALTITTPGTGYIVGEQLTVAGIGAGTGANWTATALSSGNPVIFRLDFGAQSANTTPQMWINVGAGTNGSGTIAGTSPTSKMAQVACMSGSVPSSLVTPYTSWFVYNSTYGVCSAILKQNSLGATSANFGGFLLARSNDSAGSPTANSISLVANASTTAGTASAAAGGQQQNMTWSAGAGSTVWGLSNAFCAGGVQYQNSGAVGPWGLTSTLEAGTAFVFPIMVYDPVIKYSAYMGNVMLLDVAVGSTFSTAIIGATPLTFLNFGNGFGFSGPLGGGGGNGNNVCSCVLYQ
jgi:hypothetical protein